MSASHRLPLRRLIVVQILFVAAFATAWLVLPANRQQVLTAELQNRRPPAQITLTNTKPVQATPLYDDPTVVSDEELAAVLARVLPRFESKNLRPNYVEHALRIWGAEIDFNRPDLISGPDMRDFLLDSSRYLKSWGTDAEPILKPADEGVAIRWGYDSSTSVHHDHLLASLAEASVTLDTAVYTTARRTTLKQIFVEALRDFRLDERETEWSAMAFAAYLIPQQTAVWHNSQGREISFDRIAIRLMRNHKRQGVCQGTHRVFSLMMLYRLDKQYGDEILSDSVEAEILNFLADVRELLISSQAADGSWPPNWMDGAQAAANTASDEKLYRRVIATGHHLEWLAIAPRELHPPHDRILAAADWIIANTLQTPQDVIDSNYTYYSHVGNALALWRQTSPAKFWTGWQAASGTSDSETP